MGRKVGKQVARNKKKYGRKISTKKIEDQWENIRVQEMTGFVLISLMIVDILWYCLMVVDLNNRIMSSILLTLSILLDQQKRWNQLENNVNHWI